MDKIKEIIQVDLNKIVYEYTPNNKHIKMCIENNKPVCTDTAAFTRLPIFPAIKPKNNKIVLETQWGHVTIQNPVSQRHQDLLECLLYLAKIEIDGNRAIAYVDLHKLRRKLSKNKERIPEQDLFRMIEALENVKLITEHTINSGGVQISIQVRGRIIDKTVTVLGVARNKKDKKILKVTFGDMVSSMLLLDKLLFYNPERIVKLKHSYTKAIVRFLISHENKDKNKTKKWELKRLLHYLGIRIEGIEENSENSKITISKDQYRKMVQRIKEESEELNAMGITIEKINNEYYVVCDTQKLRNAIL